MFSAVALAGLVTSLLVPVSAPDATTEAEVTAQPAVEVEVATVAGSGCPEGPARATVSQGGTLLQVTLPAYFAWAGPDAGAADFRKNCQVSLQVSRPEGWTYAVARVASSGFAYVPAGATATTRVAFYIQGTSPTGAVTDTFSGPTADTWRSAGTVPAEDLVWAPCDAERNLNVNTEVRATRGDDASATTFIVRDATTSLRLLWTRCS